MILGFSRSKPPRRARSRAGTTWQQIWELYLTKRYLVLEIETATSWWIFEPTGHYNLELQKSKTLASHGANFCALLGLFFKYIPFLNFFAIFVTIFWLFGWFFRWYFKRFYVQFFYSFLMIFLVDFDILAFRKPKSGFTSAVEFYA